MTPPNRKGAISKAEDLQHSDSPSPHYSTDTPLFITQTAHHNNSHPIPVPFTSKQLVQVHSPLRQPSSSTDTHTTQSTTKQSDHLLSMSIADSNTSGRGEGIHLSPPPSYSDLNSLNNDNTNNLSHPDNSINLDRHHRSELPSYSNIAHNHESDLEQEENEEENKDERLPEYQPGLTHLSLNFLHLEQPDDSINHPHKIFPTPDKFIPVLIEINSTQLNIYKLKDNLSGNFNNLEDLSYYDIAMFHFNRLLPNYIDPNLNIKQYKSQSNNSFRQNRAMTLNSNFWFNEYMNSNMSNHHNPNNNMINYNGVKSNNNDNNTSNNIYNQHRRSSSFGRKSLTDLFKTNTSQTLNSNASMRSRSNSLASLNKTRSNNISGDATNVGHGFNDQLRSSLKAKRFSLGNLFKKKNSNNESDTDNSIYPFPERENEIENDDKNSSPKINKERPGISPLDPDNRSTKSRSRSNSVRSLISSTLSSINNPSPMSQIGNINDSYDLDVSNYFKINRLMYLTDYNDPSSSISNIRKLLNYKPSLTQIANPVREQAIFDESEETETDETDTAASEINKLLNSIKGPLLKSYSLQDLYKFGNAIDYLNKPFTLRLIFNEELRSQSQAHISVTKQKSYLITSYNSITFVELYYKLNISREISYPLNLRSEEPKDYCIPRNRNRLRNSIRNGNRNRTRTRTRTRNRTERRSDRSTQTQSTGISNVVTTPTTEARVLPRNLLTRATPEYESILLSKSRVSKNTIDYLNELAQGDPEEIAAQVKEKQANNQKSSLLNPGSRLLKSKKSMNNNNLKKDSYNDCDDNATITSASKSLKSAVMSPFSKINGLPQKEDDENSNVDLNEAVFNFLHNPTTEDNRDLEYDTSGDNSDVDNDVEEDQDTRSLDSAVRELNDLSLSNLDAGPIDDDLDEDLDVELDGELDDDFDDDDQDDYESEEEETPSDPVLLLTSSPIHTIDEGAEDLDTEENENGSALSPLQTNSSRSNDSNNSNDNNDNDNRTSHLYRSTTDSTDVTNLSINFADNFRDLPSLDEKFKYLSQDQEDQAMLEYKELIYTLKCMKSCRHHKEGKKKKKKNKAEDNEISAISMGQNSRNRNSSNSSSIQSNNNNNNGNISNSVKRLGNYMGFKNHFYNYSNSQRRPSI